MNPPPTMTLQLRPALAAPHADVWFVPGAHAAQWLDELVGFGVDLTTAWLLPVPTSRGDRTPIGAVVVLSAGSVPHQHVRAEPWRRCGERVFVPAAAELWPPVTDVELASLVGDRWLAWHPSAGLVAFADGERVPAAALLRIERANEPWQQARPGTAVVARLRSVASAVPPTLQSLFAAEQRSIGVQSPRDLPPLPDEPPLPSLRPWSSRFGGAALDRLAAAILRLFTRPDATREATGWLRDLLSWAVARQAKRPSQLPLADEARRARELRRLLTMLDDDPENGLRFALPLDGAPGRGIAPPSNRLGERSTEFSLGALGGGDAVDAWRLDVEQRARLQKRYRELANAEIARGNHRRAAYILAHLLGDLHAAAQCLRDGRQFREAATLYRDRLADWHSAAKCLVAGGWLGEAADLYAQKGHWEDEGDLRLLLGQDEAAAAAYGRAIAVHRTNGSHVAAALLRAEKLFDVQGAVMELAQRVHDTGDARSLAAWLALMQRSGGDDAVESFLPLVLATPALGCLALLRVLSAFAPRVQSITLRALLRDQARIGFAKAVADGVVAEQLALALRALRQLSPDDPVLGRDLRVAAQWLAPPAPTARPAGDDKPPRGTLVRGWQRVGTFDDARTCVLFGTELVCSASKQVGWQLHPLSSKGPSRTIQAPHSSCFAVAEREGALYAFAWNVEHQQDVLLRLSSQASDRVESLVGNLDADALAVAADGSLWISEDGGNELHRLDREGRLLAIEALPECELETGDWTMLHAVGDDLVCVRNNQVAVRAANGSWYVQVMHARVIGVAVRPEASQNWIGLAFERGFAMFDVRARIEGRPCQHVLDRTMDAPTLGWTRNGFLVAVDEQHVTVCRGGREAHRLHTVKFCYGKPASIHALPAPDQLLFVSAQTMTCYTLR